jgi:hypothetical protein
MKGALDIAAWLCFIGAIMVGVIGFMEGAPGSGLVFIGMSVSCVISGLVFAAIGQIHERVKRTHDLMEWIAKEIQILRNGNAPGKDAE